MSLRRRPAPTGRRALVIAVVLCVLPGLGHAYLMRLTRALVWFAGSIAIAVVVGEAGDDTTIATVMAVALSLLAAADILLLHMIDSRPRGRL